MKLNELKGSTKNYVASWINKNIVPEKSRNDLKIILEEKNHKNVNEYIINTFDKLNTLRLSFISLANLFKFINGKDDINYKKYIEKAHKYGVKQRKNDDKGIISKQMKKNMITYDELIKTREKFKEKFNENPKDNKINLQYLILCLYTYEPPKRLNYINMQIKKDKLKDENDYLIRSYNNYEIIFNDKTTKVYGKAKFKLSKTLGKIISKSLREYPRKYLLSLINNNKKPIGKQMFERLLYDIFYPKKVGITILRHIYDENFYNMNPNNELKKKMAELMRHSVESAQRYYNKNQKYLKTINIDGYEL